MKSTCQAQRRVRPWLTDVVHAPEADRRRPRRRRGKRWGKKARGVGARVRPCRGAEPARDGRRGGRCAGRRAAGRGAGENGARVQKRSGGLRPFCDVGSRRSGRRAQGVGRAGEAVTEARGEWGARETEKRGLCRAAAQASARGASLADRPPVTRARIRRGGKVLRLPRTDRRRSSRPPR